MKSIATFLAAAGLAAGFAGSALARSDSAIDCSAVNNTESINLGQDLKVLRERSSGGPGTVSYSPGGNLGTYGNYVSGDTTTRNPFTQYISKCAGGPSNAPD